MSICLCYHDEQNFLHERGVCYGTKEKDPCSCGGNPVKCDFYEEVREKYIHRTNADSVREMTDEGIEEWYWWMHKEMMRYTNSRVFVHDWLKAPVKEGEG